MPEIEPIYKALGQRIRAARRNHGSGMSQEQLAERIGLPRSAVSAIEVGRQRLLTHTLLRICEVLEITPDKLLLETNGEPIALKHVQSDSSVNASDLRSVQQLIDAQLSEKQ